MSLRVFLALVCATGLCAAQSESASAPQREDSAKELVSPSDRPVADQANPPSAATPAARQSPTPATNPPAAPVIDVPPTRKTDAPATKSAAVPPSAKSNAAPVGKQATKNANAACSATGPDNSPYIIGPLDVLGIKVWGQPNLSGPVDVAADGNISMALIGDIKADGLTKEQLKGDLAKRLTDFLNNPEVDVQVLKVNSKSYFVYGGVGHPGEFPLIKPTTVMDAMSTVGGFRDFANKKRIRIQRTSTSGETQECKFNWNDVSKGKNMEQNIYLQNGDRIFVPE